MALSQRTLRRARLQSLIGRLDLYSLTSRFEKQEPLFLFARGLIFSASLIDEIRQDLPRQYGVGWGQVMTKDGLLSPEADVMIYEGSPFHEWKTDVMRFLIVPGEQVKVIVECCQFLRPTTHHKKHLTSLLKFVPRVFLFAECCFAKTNNNCRRLAQGFFDMGFEQVFYLYRWYYGLDKKDANETDWYRFIDVVRTL